jgi:hypothetical protein
MIKKFWSTNELKDFYKNHGEKFILIEENELGWWYKLGNNKMYFAEKDENFREDPIE